MNWDAISAASEFVGALGVVAAVVYLAIQVRRAISESRASTFHKIFEGLASHTNHMFGTENVDLVAFVAIWACRPQTECVSIC